MCFKVNAKRTSGSKGLSQSYWGKPRGSKAGYSSVHVQLKTWCLRAHFDILGVNQYTVQGATGRIHRFQGSFSNPLDQCYSSEVLLAHLCSVNGAAMQKH